MEVNVTPEWIVANEISSDGKLSYRLRTDGPLKGWWEVCGDPKGLWFKVPEDEVPLRFKEAIRAQTKG